MMAEGVILFADNNLSFLNVRKEFLETAGYQVITATNPEQARDILRRVPVDLAILNIRLRDDTDAQDRSGLAVAREVAPEVPKIMLTGFPSWEAVREALGPDINGISTAIDFVSKQEGPDALLRAVSLTLGRPQLKANLLHTFEVFTLMALPRRVSELGSEEASARLQATLKETSEQLNAHREQERMRASRYHFWGLLMAILGMVVVLTSAVLALAGLFEPSSLPLLGSVLAEAVGVFFFIREDAAHKRVDAYFRQLVDLTKIGDLLAICDTFQSESDRVEYKKKVIDKALEDWIVGRNP
jgi:DNA-binding response OmpR family regulator